MIDFKYTAILLLITLQIFLLYIAPGYELLRIVVFVLADIALFIFWKEIK